MKKIKKSFKKLDKVEIEWLDTTFTSGWLQEEDIDWEYQKEAMKHKSCGYFLLENNLFIAIIQSFRGVNNKAESIDSILKIPKKCIINIRKLR